MAKKKQQRSGVLAGLADASEQVRLDTLRRFDPEKRVLKSAEVPLLYQAIGDASAEVRLLAMERFEVWFDRQRWSEPMFEEIPWFLPIPSIPIPMSLRSDESTSLLLSRDYRKKLLPLLLAAGQDDSPLIRAKAAVLLGKTSGLVEESDADELRGVLRDALFRLLQDDEALVCEGAEEGWAKFDDPEGDAQLLVLLSSPSRSLRFSAFVILSQKRNDGLAGVDIPFLMEALESGEERLVKSAIMVIADHERVDVRLIEPLLRAFWKTGDVGDEGEFQRALFRQGEVAIRALRERLTEKEMVSRVRAAYLLYQADGWLSFEWPEIGLEVWEEAAKDPRYRASAYGVLARDARGGEVLARLLGNAKEESEWSEIFDALEEMGRLVSPVVSVMLRRLVSWPVGVRLRVVSMLWRVGASDIEEVSAALEVCAWRDKSEEVREQALLSLVHLKAEKAVVRLVEEQIKRGELSKAAVKALSVVKCDHPALIDCLRAFLLARAGWREHEAFLDAFGALGRTGEIGVIPVMLSFLEQEEMIGHHSLLLKGVAPFGDAALPFLADVLQAKKPSKKLLETVSGALSEMGVSALGILLKGVAHRLKDVRSACLRGLRDWPGEGLSVGESDVQRIPQKESVARVFCERLRKERSRDVLVEVVEAVADWGSLVKEAAPLLRSLLEKESEGGFFRTELLEALGNMGDVESFTALLGVLEGDNRRETMVALHSFQRGGLEARLAIPALSVFLERIWGEIGAQQIAEGQEEENGGRSDAERDGEESHDGAEEDAYLDALEAEMMAFEEDDDDWDSFDDFDADIPLEVLLSETIKALGLLGATEAVDAIVRVFSVWAARREEDGEDNENYGWLEEGSITILCLEALRRIGVLIPSMIPQFMEDIARNVANFSDEQKERVLLLGRWGVKEATEPMLRCLFAALDDEEDVAVGWLLRGLCGVLSPSPLPLPVPSVVVGLLRLFEQVDDAEVIWEGLRVLGKAGEIDVHHLADLQKALGVMILQEVEETVEEERYDEEDSAERESLHRSMERDLLHLRFLAAVRLGERIGATLEEEHLVLIERGLRILAEDLGRIYQEGLFLHAYRFEEDEPSELDVYGLQEEILEEMTSALRILAERWAGSETTSALLEQRRALTAFVREGLKRSQQRLHDVPQAPRVFFVRALGALEEVDRVLLNETLTAYRATAEEALFNG